MVKHILKDGTVLEDISGHVVKRKDAPVVYELMEQIKRKEDKNGDQVCRNSRI